MDRKISIDIDLITRITGIPTHGKYPTPMFVDRKSDRALLEAMKQIFFTIRGICNLDVANICNPTIRLVT